MAQGNPIDEQKAKALYETGSQYFDLGAYDEFLVKMRSSEKRKVLYDNLSTRFDIGTYEEYEEKLKKKRTISFGWSGCCRAFRRFWSLFWHCRCPNCGEKI